MSILDWFIDDPTMDPTEKLLMHGLQRYGQFEAMEKVGNAVLPDEDRDLSRESMKLDIATKKRMLGLPETSEDLDDSRNLNRPLWTVTAGHVLQRIPEAGFMSGNSPLKHWFGTAERIVPHDDLPGLIGRIVRRVS